MDEILEMTEQPTEETTEEIVRHFATIGAVYADGVSLIFDGEDAPTEKHYLCNTNVYFSPGDRVRILEDSGTYIVEYVVGSPKQQDTVGMPRGGDTGSALIKNSETDFDAKWGYQAAEQLGSGNIYFTVSKNGEILPSKDSGSISGCNIGSSSKWIKDAYMGGSYGSVRLCSNATQSKLSFWGADPIARQTLSTTSQNMGYTSATSSNYLKILNNIVGILKKYGLIG